MEYMKGDGQLDVTFMSPEEVLENAKAMGLLTDQTKVLNDGLQVEFEKIQTGFQKRIDNIVESWKEGMGNINLDTFSNDTSIINFASSGMKDLKGWAELVTKVDSEVVATFKRQRDAIIAAYDENERVFAASKKTEEDHLRYIRTRNELAEKGLKLNAEFAKTTSSKVIKELEKINKSYEDQLASIEKNFKGTAVYEKKKADLMIAHQARIDAALKKTSEASAENLEKMTADVEKLEANLKSRQKELESLYDLEEASGVKTHVEAEAAKAEASKQYYDDMARMYRDYLIYLKSIGQDVGDKEYDDAAKKLAEVESESRIEYQKNLKEQYDDLKDHNEKLTEAKDKVAEETRKSNEKIADLEKDHLDKVNEMYYDHSKNLVKLSRKLSDDLKKIAKDRVKAEQSTQSDILSIYSSSNDKIRDIRQRNLSDEQKETDNRREMYRKMAEGEEAVREARRTGNREELDRGRALLEQAGQIAESLENEKDAVRGIKQVTEELVDARKLEGELDKKDLAEKEKLAKDEYNRSKKDAVDEYNHKLSLSNDEHKDALAKEEERHKREMENLNKEVLKWQEKVTAAKEIISLIEKQGPSTAPEIAGEFDALLAKAKDGINVDFRIEGEDAVEKLKKQILELDGLDTTSTHTVKYKEEKSTGGPVGFVRKFAQGGDVQNAFSKLASRFINKGTGQGDDVPAMLKRGEYVHNTEAVREYGLKFMSMVNNRLIPKDLIKRLIKGYSTGGGVEIPTSNISNLVNNQLSLPQSKPNTTRMSFIFDDVGYETNPIEVTQDDYSMIVEKFRKHSRFAS